MCKRRVAEPGCCRKDPEPWVSSLELEQYATSGRGQSPPGRGDSRPDHVGDASIPTEFCVAAEFRDVPLSDVLKKSFNHFSREAKFWGKSMSENPDSLITAASIMAGFGAVFFAFRLERELKLFDKTDEPAWIPVSDWLLIAAIIISLVIVVVPLVSLSPPTDPSVARARAACAAAAIMIAGYIPSILAHYNFIYWLDKGKKRPNPTVPEAILVILTIAVAVLVYLGKLRWW